MASNNQIGLFACSAIVAGNMMGSGIALLPASLAQVGSVTFISWIIASIGAIALAYVYARLGAENPQEGGPVGYAGEVAPILGFQTGVLYFNANWVGNLAIAITGVAYLSVFFPVLDKPVYSGFTTIAVIWLFVGLNLMGAKWIGRLVTIGIVLLLIPVILTGTIGWGYFSSEVFTSNWNATGTSSTHAVFSGVLLCIWSFIGIESASVNSNLVKNPKVTIPRATMIGVTVAAIVYFLSCTAISGMLPNSVVGHSSAPFSIAINHIFGWGASVVSLIVAFACLASLGSWMMLTAQAGARAAHDGTLPKVFGQLNEKGTPVKGLLLTATGMSVLMLLVMFGFKSTSAVFGQIISIAVMMTILPYFYSALNLINVVEHPIKHFTITVTAVMAMCFCFAAYIGAESYALVGVTVVSLGSLIFYVRKDRDRYERDIYKRVHRWKLDD